MKDTNETKFSLPMCMHFTKLYVNIISCKQQNVKLIKSSIYYVILKQMGQTWSVKTVRLLFARLREWSEFINKAYLGE